MGNKNKIDAQKIIFEDIEGMIREIRPLLFRLEGKKLLITGASGMVPSYFLDTIYYLNKNCFSKKTRVSCFVRRDLTEKSRLFYLKNYLYFKFKVVDLGKPFKINGAFDYVIHAASKASPMDYLSNPIETLRTNVAATTTILEYVRSHKNCRFLFFSSGEIYGDPTVSSIDENYIGKFNHLSERACYVEAKRFAETLCYLYAKKFGITVSIARLFHTFGPGIKKGDSRIWSALIFRALKNKKMEIMDASTERSFCYISDAIKQLWYALLSSKGLTIYNIGNPQTTSIGQFANLVKKISGSSAAIINLKKRTGAWKNSPQKVRPNVDKILLISKMRITTNLEQGLKKTIAWCKKFYGY